jgi:ribosomal protein L7/L12
LVTDTPSDVYTRIAVLERQMQLLAQHTGLQLPPPDQLLAVGGVAAEVIALMRAGNKIGAVKRQRELTGCDLRDALATVESTGLG